LKVLIGMPMYNEEPDIGKHMEKIVNISKNNYSILIVDDGSTDKSKEIVKKFLKKLKIKLLEHEKNQGLSTTLNDLYYEASRILEDNDVLITMDSDDTHDPKYIEEVVRSINQGYNFVVLSRYQKGSKELGYPMYKRFLSRCVNTVLKILFPVRDLHDYTSGYRGFKGSLIKNLIKRYDKSVITAKAFAGMAEVIIKLRGFGIKAKEIPFVYRYDLKRGLSKLKLTTTIKEYSKLILKAKLKLLK